MPRTRFRTLTGAGAGAIALALSVGFGAPAGATLTRGRASGAVAASPAKSASKKKPKRTKATTPPETSSVGESSGHPLVGVWRTSYQNWLTAHRTGVDPAQMTCPGDVTLTFRFDGTYEETGSGTCTIHAQGAEVPIPWQMHNTGSWAGVGGLLRISNSPTTPVSVSPAYDPSDDLPTEPLIAPEATYDVEGSALILTFTGDTIGKVKVLYRRVG